MKETEKIAPIDGLREQLHSLASSCMMSMQDMEKEFGQMKKEGLPDKRPYWRRFEKHRGR